MAKTIDVPNNLRNFNKAFSKLNLKYDTSEVFCNVVELMVAMFIYEGDKELGDRLKKYYKNDYEQLCVCVSEMIKAYQTGISKGTDEKDWDWYDGLGEYYEVITSSYKSSRMGQFFTPKPICDFMAIVSFNEEKLKSITDTVGYKRVNDPCSGSGRFLLAFSKIAPNNYFYATDIDQICVKMTAVNMAIHGLHGQVVCANSLCYGSSWRFGYEINRDLYKIGFPSIHIITQDECVQSEVEKSIWATKKDDKIEVKKEPVQMGQLSLF